MSELAIEWLDEGSATVEDTVGGTTFDVYIQRDADVIELNKTEFIEFEGAPAYTGGGSGPSHLEYVQLAPAATWTWVHNLNSRPHVNLFIDSVPNEPVVTDMTYPNLNTVVIEWPSPETGKAYI